MIEDTTNWHG